MKCPLQQCQPPPLHRPGDLKAKELLAELRSWSCSVPGAGELCTNREREERAGAGLLPEVPRLGCLLSGGHTGQKLRMCEVGLSTQEMQLSVLCAPLCVCNITGEILEACVILF